MRLAGSNQFALKLSPCLRTYHSLSLALWRSPFAFRSCLGLFWSSTNVRPVWPRSQSSGVATLDICYPRIMFWAIAFPLDQELPNQTPALLERFLRKHVLNFINRNAFSINFQWWRRHGSILRHVVWLSRGT